MRSLFWMTQGFREAKWQSLLRPKRLYFKVKLIWVSKSKVSTICLKRSFFIFVSSNLSCSFISKYVVRNILMHADSISCVWSWKKLNYEAWLCPYWTLGSPLINGIFLVQKMCIYSCVTLSTTSLMRAVQFNERSACDASTFTSCFIMYIYFPKVGK